MPVTLLPYSLTTENRVKEQGSGIDASDPTQDEQIRFLINSASRRLMRYSGREFKSRSPQTIGTDGAMTTGSPILTSALAAFAAGDVGKAIIVQGAGILGPTGSLETTILSRQSATQVTLTKNALVTVTGAAYTYGATTRTFQLTGDGYGGGRIDFGDMNDAQSISAVKIDTQGGSAGTILDASIPEWQGLEIGQWDGVYESVSVMGTAWSGVSTSQSSWFGAKRLAEVTAIWGWPSVPEDVEHACIEQVKAWLKESQVMRTPNFDASSTGAIETRGALLPWVMRTLDMYRPLVVVG